MKKDKKLQKNTLFYVILSGIMAIVLWFFIMTIIDPEVSVSFSNVKVTIKGESELLSQKGYSILSSTDLEVDVRFKGSRNTVLKLKKSDIVVIADVSAIEGDGESKISCTVTTPYGDLLAVTNQANLNVYFTVDQMISKEMEVRVDLTGELSGGFRLASSPELSQDTVTVRGPRTEISKISHARVTANLSSLTNSIDIQSDVKFIDNSGQEMSLSYSQLLDSTVTISIKLLAVRDLDLRVGAVVPGGGLTQDDVEIEIAPAKVAVAGDINAMKELEYLNLGIIDLTPSMGDGFTTEMSFILPSGFTCLSDTTSATVSVRVKDITTRAITIPAANVTIVGEDSKYNVAIVEPNINVTVRGNSRLISTLSPSDISLTLRLADYELSPGQLPVTLSAQLLAGVNATVTSDKIPATLVVTRK